MSETVIATAITSLSALGVGYLGYRGIIAKVKSENESVRVAVSTVDESVGSVHATVKNGIHDAMGRMERMVADLSATLKVSVAMDERPIFRTTPHGALVEANDAACQLLGMTVEALQKDGWAKAVHPEDAPRVFGTWNDAVAAKRPYGPVTYRYLHPTTGKVTWVKAVAQPVIEPSGELSAWVATVLVIDPPLPDNA